MYLTELTMRGSDAALLCPGNPYNWHQVVWTFFPGRDDRDFLYRVDIGDYGIKLLILSKTQPQSPINLPQSLFRCREVPPEFLQHSRYRFQLRANPTKRLTHDKKTGKPCSMRVPLTSDEELLHWLERKGQTGGFCIPHSATWPNPPCSLLITREKRLDFRKKQLRAAHHGSVQFSGVLEVTDSELFQKTFIEGIGSAKSFGFGLLMLQPIISTH